MSFDLVADAPRAIDLLVAATVHSFLEYLATAYGVCRYGADTEANPLLRAVLKRAGLWGLWAYWVAVWLAIWLILRPGEYFAMFLACFAGALLMNNLLALWGRRAAQPGKSP
ncbi:MAG: hypothetical protein INF91_10380 [Alphaproteobacteria bacterium]|nr:hypothetical protein [Alphaproteobacteria bacterium]